MGFAEERGKDTRGRLERLEDGERSLQVRVVGWAYVVLNGVLRNNRTTWQCGYGLETKCSPAHLFALQETAGRLSSDQRGLGAQLRELSEQVVLLSSSAARTVASDSSATRWVASFKARSLLA